MVMVADDLGELTSALNDDGAFFNNTLLLLFGLLSLVVADLVLAAFECLPPRIVYLNSTFLLFVFSSNLD